jgi:NADP-dependent 3-hydroxy acid dehydrogenase YdfG
MDAQGGLLSGRVALVTGASSGLGARFARVLHEAGADVVVTARRAGLVEELADELEGLAVAGDITSAAHRQAMADAVADRFGRLDILINNAGVCDDGPLEEQTLAELTEVIQVNLVAVLDLCRVVAPLLFTNDHGSVINIASIYGLVASAVRWPRTTQPRERWSASLVISPPSGAHGECASMPSPPDISPPS